MTARPTTSVDSPRITLCGRLTIEWSGERLEASLPGRQGRLIFAFLALNRGRPVRRDELVEALWADEGLPSGGESLLAPPLSRLRKALGPGRIEGRTELELALGDAPRIDWEEARENIARARDALAAGDGETAWEAAGAAEKVLAGGLLPGLEAGWIDEWRRELDDLRLEALELLARAGARMGGSRLAQAERAAREAVGLSRFRESARAALLEVMEAGGNVAEALRAYDEFRLLLREELGSFPAPELAAIHERLLNAHETDPGFKGEVAPPAGGSSGQEGILPAPSPPEVGRLIDPRFGRIDLVGRESVLENLGDELDRAVGGGIRFALLSGEGGLGKTRVAAELAASRDDITVLYGRAEQDEVRPLRIWTGLLRSALVHVDADNLARIIGNDGPALARILPELVSRMNLSVPGSPGNLESERRALFDAVMRMIGRLSAVRPMLIILDDLQWADRTTLLMLASLAGDHPPGGVLALGLYRDDELPNDSLLTETVLNLQRRLPAVRLELEPLSTADVARLIEGRLDPKQAGQLRDQAGGNPFLIEQIVRHLEEVGEREADPVPVEARQIVMRRVTRLSEGGSDLLARAALIGRDFDLETLERITRLDEDRVIELLDEASLAGLLDESELTPGRYSFVHTLLREALADELSLTRRARVHRDIGEAIEQQVRDRPDRRLGELAWHFGLAGPAETDRAIFYASRAAEQAEHRLAYDEAVDFYSAAIAALTMDEPVDQGLHANLLLGRAEAEWRLGHLHRAGTTFFDAAIAARESGLPELVARAAIGTSWGSWETFDSIRQTPISLLEEALVLLGPEDSPLRAEAMANLGHLTFFNGDSSKRAVELTREALAIAERLDEETLFRVLVASHFYLLQSTTPTERLEAGERAVAIAERSPDPEDLAEALALRAVMLVNAGRGAEAEADVARHAALSETLPQVRATSHSLRAVQCFLHGEWDEGERLTAACLADEHMPPSARIAMIDAMHYMSLAPRGRLGEVMDTLEKEARVAATWNTWPAWETGLALGSLQAGDPDRMRELLRDINAIELGPELQMDLLRPVFCGVATLLATELEDPEMALRLTDLLEEMDETWTIFGPGGATFGPPSLLRGELYLLQGRDREAATALENALVACERMSARPFQARANLALAEALDRLGSPDGRERSNSLRTTGVALASELEMAPLLARYAGRADPT